MMFSKLIQVIEACNSKKEAKKIFTQIFNNNKELDDYKLSGMIILLLTNHISEGKLTNNELAQLILKEYALDKSNLVKLQAELKTFSFTLENYCLLGAPTQAIVSNDQVEIINYDGPLSDDDEPSIKKCKTVDYNLTDLNDTNDINDTNDTFNGSDNSTNVDENADENADTGKAKIRLEDVFDVICEKEGSLSFLLNNMTKQETTVFLKLIKGVNLVKLSAYELLFCYDETVADRFKQTNNVISSLQNEPIVPSIGKGLVLPLPRRGKIQQFPLVVSQTDIGTRVLVHCALSMLMFTDKNGKQLNIHSEDISNSIPDSIRSLGIIMEGELIKTKSEPENMGKRKRPIIKYSFVAQDLILLGHEKIWLRSVTERLDKLSSLSFGPSISIVDFEQIYNFDDLERVKEQYESFICKPFNSIYEFGSKTWILFKRDKVKPNKEVECLYFGIMSAEENIKLGFKNDDGTLSFFVEVNNDENATIDIDHQMAKIECNILYKSNTYYLDNIQSISFVPKIDDDIVTKDYIVAKYN